MSDSLQPHGLQHTRLLYSSLYPRVCSNSSPLISQSLLKFMSIESVMLNNHLILCHPLLLPSVFPSIRVFSNESALRIRGPEYCSFSLATVLSMNIQDCFPLRLTGLISLQSKELSRVVCSTTIWKYQFFSAQPYLWPFPMSAHLWKKASNSLYSGENLVIQSPRVLDNK